MPIDRARVQQWLRDYIHAWQTYDADAIGALFTEDARYAWHPWDTDHEAVRGRRAIVDAWLGDKDAPGTYSAEYAPLAVDGDLAIATGKSMYVNAEGAVEREYYNCFVMRFDDAGRCREFTEWFMQKRTPS